MNIITQGRSFMEDKKEILIHKVCALIDIYYKTANTFEMRRAGKLSPLIDKVRDVVIAGEELTKNYQSETL